MLDRPVRIHFQLLSSESRGKAFIEAVQKDCDRAASPGTKVDVRGTKLGALADDFRLFQHYDAREVIDTALRIRKEGGYDAYVFGNSLDVAVTDLREILDIPVITLMEVCCHVACTMGRRFSVIVPNDKFVPRYQEIVEGYGLDSRCAGVLPLQFNYVPDQHRAFDERMVGDAGVKELERAAKIAVERGAEVLVVPGPSSTLLKQRGITSVEGAVVLDSYPLLVKWAEMMVGMHRLTGTYISRLRHYRSPPKELLIEAAGVYGIPLLADG